MERITILGRRGPHQITMTPKELGELAELERASPRVDAADLPDEGEDALLEPGLAQIGHPFAQLRRNPRGHRAEKRIEIEFDFFAHPR